MQNKITQKIEKIIIWIANIFLFISCIMVFAQMLSVDFGVFMRYVFNSPEPYSYEISTILMLTMFIFAIATVDIQNRYIKVDIIASRLSKNKQNIITNIISPILGIFFCAILIWKGWDSAMYSLRINELTSTLWQVYTFPIKITIPIGYGALFLALILRLYKGIVALKGSR